MKPDRAIRWIADRLRPITPWLYAGLCRALIPTTCWALVAFLFLAVPQTRDVLHGLGEPLLRSIGELNDNTQPLVNHVGLTSFAVTALGLGIAIWYAGRYLMDEDAIGAGDGKAGMRGILPEDQAGKVAEWVPRLQGISALAVAAAALVFASYTPHLARLPALGLSALGVGPPLGIAASLLGKGTFARWKLALIVAGVAEIVAVVLLARSTGKLLLFLWCVVVSCLPALLLVVQVQRREWLKRRERERMASGHVAKGDFGQKLQQMILLTVLSLLPLAILAWAPVSYVRAFGTAAAVMVYISALVFGLAVAQVLLRQLASGVPGLTAAVLILVTVLVALIGDESLGREKLELARQPAPSVPTPPETAAPPHLHVNAYGGGLRAALFTAETLAMTDDATCGEFGEHLVRLSGVSGGSLGIAVYLVSRQELRLRGDGWGPDCAAGTTRKPVLTSMIRAALIQDHLSAAVARLLAIDAPHMPGSPARGQALLDSWQSALIAALERKDGTTPLSLALPLGELTGGAKHPIDVFFNSADADTGQVVWFSNRDGGSVGTHTQDEPAAARDLAVGLAVLHSARFPIITPAGAYRASWETPAVRLRLVDGGYADNSGALTLLRAKADGAPDPVHAWSINIDGNPPSESVCHDPRGSAPILTAVRALLESRTARATLAVRDLQRTFREAQHVNAVLNLEQAYGVKGKDDREGCEKVSQAHKAPLGWYMSYDAAQALETSVRSQVTEMCGKLQLRCLPVE